MKNKMGDVRDHLVAMMERLGDKDCTAEDLAKAKALSELAQTYTNTVKVEVDARKLLQPSQLPPAIAALPAPSSRP
jgi:hypothetical protein